MHFAEEHCFGCASVLCDCVDEYGYRTTHKTFTTRLKGILHLWKDECEFKMGHLCKINVK